MNAFVCLVQYLLRFSIPGYYVLGIVQGVEKSVLFGHTQFLQMHPESP